MILYRCFAWDRRAAVADEGGALWFPRAYQGDGRHDNPDVYGCLYLAVHAVSQWAAARARTNRGPTLIEWVTYRVGAHSTSDDPSGYRPSDEAAAWPLGDPIERLRRHLVRSDAWDDERHAALGEEVDRVIADAFTEAESHGYTKGGDIPSPATMFDDIYATLPRHLWEQRQALGY